MRNVKVAGIQILCDRTKEEMLEKAEQYMDAAYDSTSGIDLFVLPEQFYQIKDSMIESETYGEEPHKKFERWVSKCAKKYKSNIIAGSYAVKIGDKVKNRSIVADRRGNIVGFYDKIHLFDAFGVKESDTFDAGDELGLFDLDIGKLGVWICYDTRFPEISRSLAYKGADFMCVPAAFYKPNTEHWETLIKAAAIYNIVPVIAVNQYGDFPNGRGLLGRSMIVDQKGLITAGISDKEGYFIGEIDLDYTDICRKRNPEMVIRRVDLYRKIL